MSAALQAGVRSEPDIQADLVHLAAESRRLEETVAMAKRQQQTATSKLAELDAAEAAAFLGEVDPDDHRAARRQAETQLAEAAQTRSAALAAAPGLSDRRSALEKELHLCRLEGARGRLAEALPVRNAASREFAAHVKDAFDAREELEAARAIVRSIKNEIVDLGGEELPLGPADVADEPDWSPLPAAIDGSEAAHDLARTILAGPDQPTEELKRREAEDLAAAESKRLKDETYVNQAARFDWALDEVPPHLRERIEARRTELRAEAARRREELARV